MTFNVQGVVAVMETLSSGPAINVCQFQPWLGYFFCKFRFSHGWKRDLDRAKGALPLDNKYYSIHGSTM